MSIGTKALKAAFIVGAMALSLAAPAHAQFEDDPEFQEVFWCTVALGLLPEMYELNQDEIYVADRGHDFFVALQYDHNLKHNIGEEDYRVLLERHGQSIADELMTKPYKGSGYRMIDRCFSRAMENIQQESE